MNIRDEELMAYADGELAAERRRALDDALAADATLRARVAALRARRQQVASAYAGVLDEPVPERLRTLLAPPASATVIDLAGARVRKVERGLSWAHWGGMAACVLLGVLMGLLFAPRSGDALLGEHGGHLVAGGALAQALNAQLASEAQPTSAVAVQLSFVDKGGRYCRTFSSAQIAGLACRDGAAWSVVVASRAEALRQKQRKRREK